VTSLGPINIPDYGCPITLLPSPGQLSNLMKQISRLPAQLEVYALRLAEAEAAPYLAAANSIRHKLQDILSLLGIFPISGPSYAKFHCLEIEWEQRARAIVSEFKLYLIQKALQIIASVIPVSFIIPVPFLGGVDIVRLFSDASYRASLKARIVSNVEGAISAIARPFSTFFTGLYGVMNHEITAQEIWSYIINHLTTLGYQLIYGLFAQLISKFKIIWNTLHLPALVDLLTLDVEGLIQGVIDSVEHTAINYAQQVLSRIENIQIFGFRIVDLLDASPTDLVQSAEIRIMRLIQAAKDFAAKWPMYLLENWMSIVKKFFTLIGLGALLSFIPFTFCTFLQLIGFPTSFNLPPVPQLPIQSLPSGV
jgi:hypothetical protein